MVQRTVLKVNISCPKCKKQLIKSVSVLQGLDKIEVDEGKGTLTVTGNADPYDVIVRTRKSGKFVQVVSIGPPPPPPKQDETKQQEDKKPVQAKKPSQEIQYINPQTYNYPVCPRVVLVEVPQWQEPNPSCSIL